VIFEPRCRLGATLGVHALHLAGKTHRDVKPSNVLVTTGEEHVVLLDFGVATGLAGRGDGPPAEGEVVGTPRHIAPEHADGASVTPACDWYSVGVMVYEALVGRLPHSLAASARASDPTERSSCPS
jgi:serine/threonine protein kinase